MIDPPARRSFRPGWRPPNEFRLQVVADGAGRPFEYFADEHLVLRRDPLTFAELASTDAIAMLVSSQNPDRVSNILRSSTPTIRPNGIGLGAGRLAATLCAAGRSRVVAVMLRLLLVVTRR